MSTFRVEFWAGLFVIFGALSLAWLAIEVSGASLGERAGGYTLYAEFDNVSGLRVRAKVSVAGVPIGRVRAIHVDAGRYRARVEMEVDASMRDSLPFDTGARILTEGILGAKYIGLLPGGAEEMLAEGDVIEDTQGSVMLENLINDLVSRLTR